MEHGDRKRKSGREDERKGRETGIGVERVVVGVMDKHWWIGIV